MAVLTTSLGVGLLVGSLTGIKPVGASPQIGQGTAATSYIACDCEVLVTTTDLNLRTGPGTSYDVMRVMPMGTKVQAAIPAEFHQNGFVKLIFNGEAGWASEEYLADSLPTADTGGYDIVDTAVTTSAVNFRKGPGTDYGVQDVVEEGAQIGITDLVTNGFRYVWHAGLDGWIYDEYLVADAVDPGSGGSSIVGTAVTNDDVNFRGGPGTNHPVYQVLLAGTTVELTEAYENGFRFVFVNGSGGWVYEEYLGSPASLPNATPTGTATTTDEVNFRTGPGTDFGIYDVLSAGTEVETTDGLQNGFRYVVVNGQYGWIHADYLS